MASASSGRLAHRTVRISLCAGIVANAVPHEPAPTTATSTSSVARVAVTRLPSGGPLALLPSLGVARAQILYQLRELVHHLVGDGPQRLVVRSVLGVAGEIHRGTGLDPDRTAELQAARPILLPHGLRPPHNDREDRH